ncbi:putative membrane protein [Vulcaniibacterium tengchongense]|uniref:Putative membrane protein n=1 Tax=Vulcaniibacterium tengchongense TaxID=1273429 RepID=A0A3N4VRB8_9GAMM|nr:putative membrane protein [Vulcaniibacterium tengchongense]
MPPAPTHWPLFCAIVFVVGLVFTAIVPPFQAPDEFHHVQRAYLLSRGQVILKSHGNQPSGGEIDAALARYMDTFTPIMGKAARKVSRDEILTASEVRWSDKTVFATPTGTAYYFPALYLPEALAMSFGRATGLTVGQSYKLARLAALLTCVILLSIAFYLYPPPIGVLAVLLLPMNLFLLSSAVLDGLATSTSILTISAFLRLIGSIERAKNLASCSLVISVALVASCRANMLPMLLLPFVAAFVLRDRRMLIAALIVALFVVTWTLFTINTTVYPPGPRGSDSSARLLFFLSDPIGLARILWNTLADPALRAFYLHSFIGVLGWLDAPLPELLYPLIAALLFLIVIATTTLRSFSWLRGVMLIVVASSALLTFLALLVQWTIGPATKVEGVQGRYFVIPAMFLIYALTCDPTPRQTLRRRCATALTCLLAVISIYAATSTLVARYHTAPQQASVASGELQVAAPLTAKQATQLIFAPPIAAEHKITELRIRIGTYRMSHPGRAKLVVWMADGKTSEHLFELASLEDNEYAAFRLKPGNYVGGRLESIDGEGVSVYQVSFGPALVSCLTAVTEDGRTITTAGCP